MTLKAAICFAGGLICVAACKERNAFSFCRDFDPSGCTGPVQGTALYPLEKSERSKTVRDFANSVYFRGDRLAFALKNADSKYAVTFECLHGRYTFANDDTERKELEYLELRDNNVYGLVMVGSLIEKKYAALKSQAYKPLDPFAVTYTVYCHKDVLAKQTITVAFQ